MFYSILHSLLTNRKFGIQKRRCHKQKTQAVMCRVYVAAISYNAVGAHSKVDHHHNLDDNQDYEDNSDSDDDDDHQLGAAPTQ